jgi:AraC family transcriptional regulator
MTVPPRIIKSKGSDIGSLPVVGGAARAMAAGAQVDLCAIGDDNVSARRRAEKISLAADMRVELRPRRPARRVGETGMQIMSDDYTVGAHIAVAGIAVEVRDYSLPSPYAGTVQRSRHTLSLSLSPRVVYSQCAYLDADSRAGPWVDVGDVIFAPAGVATLGRGSGGKLKRLVCSFEPEAFTRLTGLGTTWSERELVAGLDVQMPTIKRDLYRLASEVAEREAGSAIVTEALGRMLAVELSRYLRRALQPARPVHGALANWQIRRITDYVESMVEAAPTIDKLAQLCELSSRHLRRAFKESMGRTIGDYVKETRLIKAKSLLVDTNLAQKEIAHRLGFSSPTSFGVAFGRAVGMTPKQFRIKYK